MYVHEFKKSALIAVTRFADVRCAECGEVRTHINHAYTGRVTTVNARMVASLHNLPYETVQLIQGVAFLMLCDKVAAAQPDGSITGGALVELWVRNALNQLAAEGMLKIGVKNENENPDILGPELVH